MSQNLHLGPRFYFMIKTGNFCDFCMLFDTRPHFPLSVDLICYVCKYTCMYTCMYVCVNKCIYGWSYMMKMTIIIFGV